MLTKFPLRTPFYGSAALWCKILFSAWGKTNVSAPKPLRFVRTLFRCIRLPTSAYLGAVLEVLDVLLTLPGGFSKKGDRNPPIWSLKGEDR